MPYTMMIFATYKKQVFLDIKCDLHMFIIEQVYLHRINKHLRVWGRLG